MLVINNSEINKECLKLYDGLKYIFLFIILSLLITIICTNNHVLITGVLICIPCVMGNFINVFNNLRMLRVKSKKKNQINSNS